MTSSVAHRVSPLPYILGLSIFSVMGVTINAPAIPIIATYFGIPANEAWGILTYFAIPSAIIAPIAGVLADRYGRKQIIIPCLVLFAIGGAGCAMAQSYESLLIWRAIQGLGSGPLAVLNGTIAADEYPVYERPRIMGFTAMAITVSTAFFPFIGGISSEWSWRFPFWLSLLALPLALGMTRLNLPYKGASTTWKRYARQCLDVISTSTAITLFSINFLFFFVFYGPIANYVPVLADYLFQASSTTIGMIFLFGTLGAFFVAAFAGQLARNFAMRSLLLTAWGLYTLAFISIFFISSVWWLLVPVWLCSLAQGLTMPVLNSRASMLAEGEGRGAAMAANGLMFRLSQASSPAISGLAWAMLGPYGPYMLALFFCGILLWVLFTRFPAKLRVADSIGLPTHLKH